MSRKVSSAEAREAKERAEGLISALENALGKGDFFSEKVREAVAESRRSRLARYLTDVTAEEIVEVLPDVSADLLSRRGIGSAADVYLGSARDYGDAVSKQVRGLVDECVRRLGRMPVCLDDAGKSPDVSLVAPAARSLLAYRSIEPQIRSLLDVRRDECLSLAESARPIGNPIRRLFVSRDERVAAAAACEELSSLLDGDFGKEARDLLSRYDSAHRGAGEGALADYRGNPEVYRSVVELVDPGCVGSDSRSFFSSDAARAQRQVDALLSNLDSAGEVLASQDEPIRRAVERCLARSLLKALEDIPVEELNRDKSGIRASALAKAGYTTIADVYGAPDYVLRSIKGVGDSSVFEIKRRTRQYAETAREGLKLRLTADDRTQESTQLVVALHKRIRLASLCKSCSSLCAEKQSAVSEAQSGLRVALKGMTWIFASEAQIELAERSYRDIRELIDGAFGTYARNLLKQVAEARNSSPDQNVAWDAFVENPIAFNETLEEICPDVVGGDGLYGLPEDLAREVQEECFFPDGLLCTLRRYQEWGVKYILHQGKVLLGDEMGLGKTVQAIAVMVSLRNVGHTHFVVVCPASVLENWCREIRKHSKLSVTKVHGYTAERAFEGWVSTGGVAVTTYETTSKLQLPEGFSYGLAIVDEAHYIKNPGAARTANTLRLCEGTDRILFMTGTALENKVDEMLQLIGDLRPDVAMRATPLAIMSGAKRFRDVIAPVYYRRKRSDVLSELPDLIESEDWCQLGPIEEKAYEEVLLSRNFMDIRRVSWNVEDLANSSKARRLRGIVDEVADDGRKTLVFTYFRDVAWNVANMLGDQCVGVINGSVPVAKRQDILEEFDKAPAGSVLVAQIQSGGTGLNIQCASVVVICEPQFKPSIENQAISRAYRMGQARNVLVHRLLCENTVDERLTKLLQEKQRTFDAFADKSSAAAAEPSVDNDSFGKIVEDEIERIKKQRGAASEDASSGPTDDGSGFDSKESGRNDVGKGHGGKRPDVSRHGGGLPSSGYKQAGAPSARPIQDEVSVGRTYSVTGRAKSWPQPCGGYLPPRLMNQHVISAGHDLNGRENLAPNIVGMAVDYLTRFRLDPSRPREAFVVSLRGANLAGKTNEAERLLGEISELGSKAQEEWPDSGTIAILASASAVLSSFDVYYRSPQSVRGEWEACHPDKATIENIWEMSNRTLGVLRESGGETVYYDPSLQGGYSPTVSAGDADYLAGDVLWDLKVSKNPPKTIHTLQLLMYWRMGCNSWFSNWEDVKRLGIINPRLGTYYLCSTDEIGDDVIHSLDDEVIAYPEQTKQIKIDKMTFEYWNERHSSARG